ncbi:hypothetical protein KQX54_011191 [Cotesia glomerata]|uniref:Uncharacterized protein n=1 Tax=Cotesia glomerata TaxID=32391 RepID=A0AAV7I211_COTGL|nr:hypothetical protein KQX54_011191 [Cotesia glomerata]
MDKQRRNKSFSNKAISRRNLKKIKIYLDFLSCHPNIPTPNNFEQLPAKLSCTRIRHDYDIKNQSSKPTPSHDHVTEKFVNSTVHDSAMDCSEDNNSSTLIDENQIPLDRNNESENNDGNNACFFNDENQIPVDKNNEEEHVNAEINNSVKTRNFRSFNISMNFTNNIFMFQNRNTTVKDHLLCVVALSLRHHWSYECILDTFRYINNSYGSTELPTTKQALWKALGRNDSQVIKYFYCRECDDFLGEKSKISDELQQ